MPHRRKKRATQLITCMGLLLGATAVLFWINMVCWSAVDTNVDGVTFALNSSISRTAARTQHPLVVSIFVADNPVIVSNNHDVSGVSKTDNNKIPTNATVEQKQEQTPPQKHQQQQLPYKAAAAMLVARNWMEQRDNRKCHFNKSLDLLQQYWHPTHQHYPVILQRDDQDWPASEQETIRRQWPLLTFQFLNIRPYIQTPVPAVRQDNLHFHPFTIPYKRMCRYKAYGFLDTPALRDLDYVMMFDDDSCLTEPLTVDIFHEMHSHPTVAYGYKQLFTEPSHVVVGLKNFVLKFARERNLTMANPNIFSLQEKPFDPQATEIWRARKTTRFPWLQNQTDFDPSLHFYVFSTNLEWIDVRQYRTHEGIQDFFRAIDDSQMIFHRRWGDAPLRMALASLFWNASQIMHVCGVAYQHSGWSHPSTRTCPTYRIDHALQTTLQTCSQACPGGVVSGLVRNTSQNCAEYCG